MSQTIITKNLEDYTKFRVQSGLEILINRIHPNAIEEAAKFHHENTFSNQFQTYYMEILKNETLFLNQKNYFSVFKSKYGLQGIDSNHLQSLEDSKEEILTLLQTGDLITLYQKYFWKQKIKHKEDFIEKDLNSFFTKFVHTFYPDSFPALDNPIKLLLGFEKESFLFAFFCIATIYQRFIFECPNQIQMIREIFKQETQSFNGRNNAYSDIKLLDLILWKMANLDSNS